MQPAPCSPSFGPIIRLAAEGVPIMAITRALQRDRVIVEGAISVAIHERTLSERPPLDWPAADEAQVRGSVVPPAAMLQLADDLVGPIMSFFRCAPQQARMIAILMAGGTVLRPMVWFYIAGRGAGNARLIDVVAHRARQRLERLGLTFQTLPSVGYYMDPAVSERLLDILTAPRAAA